MSMIRKKAEKIAPTDATVLITGENGTGKDVLAGEIHRMSDRSLRQMVCVDAGAITETLFENRFMHVAELNRMGAKITTADRSANIEGPAKLVGCDVRATDLRAGAAMILAGLVAEGETRIGDLHHIDRGYEDIVEKLKNLGADIERVDV